MSEPRRKPVGYKNPPHHTRFKPGQSGNPKGRPRKDKSAAADYLFEAMMQKLPATNSGRKTSVVAGKAFYFKLLQMALGGNEKAMKMLLDQIKLYGIEGPTPADDEIGDPGEELFRRLKLIVDRRKALKEMGLEQLPDDKEEDR